MGWGDLNPLENVTLAITAPVVPTPLLREGLIVLAALVQQAVGALAVPLVQRLATQAHSITSPVLRGPLTAWLVTLGNTVLAQQTHTLLATAQLDTIAPSNSIPY
jgi:hypothetical protein